MKKKPHITEEEHALFNEYMKGVKPLHFKTRQQYEAPSPKNIKRPIIIHQPDPMNPIMEPFKIDDTVPIVQSEDSLQFKHPGIPYTTLQKMRQGKIQLSGELDLHGMTLDEAAQQLSNFLAYAIEQEWRYVLVIHGKGTYQKSPHPILKNKVNQWLRAHPNVLAFCSANPFQGGVGAVYVLLRRTRNY